MSDFLILLSKTPPLLLAVVAIGVIITFIGGLSIIKVAADNQAETNIETRLDKLEQQSAKLSDKLDLIIQMTGGNNHKSDTHLIISLPTPAPEKHVGWETVLKDTFDTSSTDKIDQAKLNKAFAPITLKDSLVNLVLADKIYIKSVFLKTAGANGDDKKSGYRIALEIENKSGNEIKAYVPKGQVFENKEPKSGLQNIVSADDYVLSLSANEQKIFPLNGYCLNRNLKPPIGQEANITPLKVNFAFNDQTSLWNGIDSLTGKK